MRIQFVTVLSIAFACSSGRAESEARRSPHPVPGARSQAAAATAARQVAFSGTCDASGAVPIDSRLFALADDEDNVLRIYDAEKGGAPLHAVDVSPALHPNNRKKKFPESDLEAATRLGDVALWLSSHARSKKGKAKPDRLRYFSTNVPQRGAPITLQGAVYNTLLADLLSDEGLRPFGLADAADVAPQERGGLNIEGMTAMPDGRVLLGFRNPVPDGLALLVPVRNPLAPFQGKRPRFDEPIRLDLQGLGVRALSSWRGKYLIAAGHYAEGGDRRLYEWAGPGATPVDRSAALPPDINAEAFFTPEDRDEFMVLSDDGSLLIDGERCKDLDDPRAKRFRGVWTRIDGS